jgi:hypothetical protein
MSSYRQTYQIKTINSDILTVIFLTIFFNTINKSKFSRPDIVMHATYILKSECYTIRLKEKYSNNQQQKKAWSAFFYTSGFLLNIMR